MGASDPRSDGELLAATQSGDGVAFGVFYRRHLPAVLRRLLAQTRDREVTADLAAEVFATALVSARRYRDRDGGSAGPWLRGIADNKLRESRRRRRVEDRARRRLGLEPEALTDRDLERVEELAGGSEVLELVDGLPERQRAAVRARVIDEREYAEIAAELQCSAMVVRQQVSRGLSRLRERLEND